ncbi:MAG TPA: CHASE2 domain-containing protein [Bradyrhizobium sp.]|nr:CHASE2 domain-containing protein [Bradyrhizobium sp.]
MSWQFFLDLQMNIAQRLQSKGWGYWNLAAIIIVGTSVLTEYVYNHLHAETARAGLFQRILAAGPRPVIPRFTKVILVEDDDYWLGTLAGRRPIKRDYLARLVEKLVDLNAHVIALDFDVRLQNPRSMDIPPDYRVETQELIETIKKAAEKGKKLVLATPVSGRNGIYQRDPDIYQASGLCTRSGKEVSTGEAGTTALHSNVSCGYIALPFDPLEIPGPLQLADGSSIDSFSLAIAKARNSSLASVTAETIAREARYSSFIPHDRFTDSGSEFSARALMDGAIRRDQIDSQVVIVGAHWSRDAAGRGPRVDLHWTPVGMVVGAELHANFAEAFLDSRVFSAAPEWVPHFVEILLSVMAAIAFAAIPNISGKVVGLAAAVLLLFATTWVGLQQFGLFFDAFIPIIGLGLHSLGESVERLIRLKETEPAMADARHI